MAGASSFPCTKPYYILSSAGNHDKVIKFMTSHNIYITCGRITSCNEQIG